MNVRYSAIFFVLAGLFFVVTLGCGDGKKGGGESTPATAKDNGQGAVDPHDVPMTAAEIEKLKGEMKSYDTAVARIKSYRDTIRDKIAADKPTEAHRSLDELDFVLGWLPEIAKDSGVPRENWETVSTSAQTLRDSFNEVHAAIDDKKDPNYKAVANRIDAAVTQLQEVQANKK
jgi:hypothetical protein